MPRYSLLRNVGHAAHEFFVDTPTSTKTFLIKSIPLNLALLNFPSIKLNANSLNEKGKRVHGILLLEIT